MKFSITGYVDEWVNYFYNHEMWIQFSVTIFKIILILIIGKLIIQVSRKVINRWMVEKSKRSPSKDQRRAKTLSRLAASIISYVVNFIVILTILSHLNIKLAPLLAGVGIVGIAVGFGAQSLVKDIFSGFFIVFEDQFSVGDLVQIGQFKGTVEMIGLRTTKLKSWTGEVHIIPNGSITEVTNFSMYNSVGVLDIPLAYDTDTDIAIQLIEKEVSHLYRKNENVVKEPQVLGVERLEMNEVVIRVTVECKPNTQADVLRLMKAQVKRSLENQGIEMAHSNVITYQK